MGGGHSTTARSRSAGPGLDLLDLGRDGPKWGDIQGKPIRPRHIASIYDSIFPQCDGLVVLRSPSPDGHGPSSSISWRLPSWPKSKQLRSLHALLLLTFPLSCTS